MIAATLRKVINLVSDRRQVPRREAQLSARFVVLAPDGQTELVEPRPSRVLNLSSEGCCLAVASLHLDRFHLNRCLESPEDYTLLVIMQGPDGQVWRAQGLVRWTNREVSAADLPFRVGVEWLGQGLPEGCQTLLRRPKV
ncbi:MAG: hypothetical protein LDL11_01295 [Desulfarculus sp.]|nr:hypothetical protein [Desulfarculus sp.]